MAGDEVKPLRHEWQFDGRDWAAQEGYIVMPDSMDGNPIIDCYIDARKACAAEILRLSTEVSRLSVNEQKLKDALRDCIERMDRFHNDYDNDLVWREDEDGCPYTHDFICDSELLMENATAVLVETSQEEKS